MKLITFKEFIEEDKDIKSNNDKLEKVYRLLSSINNFRVSKSIDEYLPNSYLFVQIPINSKFKEDFKKINLGIRIYVINKKLSFRLQNGFKGNQIGPAKQIEFQEEIENMIDKGKTEDQAYNEILRNLPNKLKRFMQDVYSNILKKYNNKNIDQKDMEIERNIITSMWNNLDLDLKL
jgi:hypothetical protein